MILSGPSRSGATFHRIDEKASRLRIQFRGPDQPPVHFRHLPQCGLKKTPSQAAARAESAITPGVQWVAELLRLSGPDKEP